MPDTSPTPPYPSASNTSDMLARLNKTLAASAPPTPAAPAPAPDGSISDPPTTATATNNQNLSVQTPPKTPEIIDLTRPLPRTAPAPSRPTLPETAISTALGISPRSVVGSFADSAGGGIDKGARSVAAAHTESPSLATSPEQREAIQSAINLHATTNARVDSYLKARGYDEPVQLVGASINLPETIKKMEAAALTKKAQAMGYGDWFQVPPGPAQEAARAEVVEQVGDDLRHAATVGQGAIFVDPDPFKTTEWLSKLPPVWAATAATLLPRTTATFAPSGERFQTESPVQPALRTVSALGTVFVAAPGKAALATDPLGKLQQAREAEHAADDEEDDAKAGDLRAQAHDLREDALKTTVAAALGKTPEQVSDWRAWLTNENDPEATRKLVEAVRSDPMTMQVMDQLADDVERTYGLSGYTMKAIRGTLDLAGLGMDFLQPDPVTPAIAGLGAAARAGMRLAGDTDDLLRGAKALRVAAQTGGDFGQVARDADGAYRGLGEALQIRVAAAAKVNPDVVANVRRLQGAVGNAEQKLVKAQADLVAARGTAGEAIAAREVAQTQADGARLQVELAQAHAAFAEDAAQQWAAYGEGNIKRAEILKQQAMEVKRQAWAAEYRLENLTKMHESTIAKLDERNKVLRESVALHDEAVAEAGVALDALKDAKARATVARKAKNAEALAVAKADQAAAERALALSKEKQAQTFAARRAAVETQKEALSFAGPAIDQQSKAIKEVLDLHAEAARLEQEAGWRTLSVADKGKAADEALETSGGILRKAGLMPDVPPPHMGSSLDDMIARGRAWGDAVKEAQVQAAARLAEAERAHRDANRLLHGSDLAAQRAADKSLKEVADLAEAQYKRELAVSRASAWKREAEGLADDVERGMAALKKTRRSVSERAGNILDGAVLSTSKDGSRVLDTAAFRAKMERAYSPEALRWWLAHAGDDRPIWQKALGFPPPGRDWSAAELSRAHLSATEALALQQGEEGLREGIKRTHSEASAIAQTEALLALRRDPGFRAAGFMDTTPNALGRYYADKWEHWRRSLDPMIVQIGDGDAKLVQVSKMASRRASLARDELLMVGRLAQAPKGVRGLVTLARGGTPEIIRDLTRYMDSTEAIELFGRSSIFNRGPETVWDRCRRQLLNDPSVIRGEEGAVEAEKATLAPGWTDSTIEIANRPLLGLSRAWLPRGIGVNGRQSGMLWKAAAEELERATTFDAFQKAMRNRTAGIIGSVEQVPDKAVSFLARNAAQAAVQADTAELMVRELGGILTAEEAADVNRVMTYDWDRIESAPRAWEGLARTGAPFTQNLRLGREAATQQQGLVRMATTRGGEDVYAMASQVRALDDTLDKVVKETFGHYSAARTPEEAALWRHSLDLQQFWKSSVTIGLAVPNPRYFINNIAGNLSQIWLTQGLGTGARVGFQSIFHVMPVVGPLFERALDAAATRLGDTPFLGSMIESIWNPNVTRILGGEAGTFKAANGIVYDLPTVARWASEDGVLTSFMQEEYGKMFGRSRGQGALTRFRYLQDDIFAWANEIEVRQRTALYTDLLRQGYTRSAARERTLRAMYDWEGALGAAESKYMTTLIPFYRFMKLGFRQAWYEAVAKPLIKPGEAIADALRGNSGLARMRNQGDLLRLPELWDDGDYQTEADKFDAMARYRNLDYLNRRVSWTERNDPNTVEMYRGTRGQFLPYRTITLPALTALDMGNLVAMSLQALPAVALSATDMTAADSSQRYWDELASMSGPLASPFIGLAAQTMGADSQTTRDVARLKPGEAALAQALGLSVGVGPDYQSTVGTAFTKAIVTSMPGLMQIPQWYDAFYGENPEVHRAKQQGYVSREQVAPYFQWAAGQVSNFGRSYPVDPDQILTQRQRKLHDELTGGAEAETGDLRERQAVKP